MKTVVAFFFFFLTFFLHSSLEAQWVQTPGPEGGSIRAIIVTPSAIVASAVGTGIVRSTDAGATWSLINSSLRTVGSLFALGDTVYAGDTSIEYSTDAGLTWSKRSNGLIGNERIGNIITSQGDLFACSVTRSTLSNYIARVYRSTDHGATWDSVSSLPEPNGTFFMPNALLADVSGTLLINNDSTIYRSLDHGNSWIVSNNGMDNLTRLLASSLAVNGQMVAISSNAGILISSDGGKDWQIETTGTPLDLFSGACAWEGNQLIASSDTGVFLQHGTTWTEVDSTPLVQDFSSEVNPSFAGSYSMGVLYSSNQGTTWTQMDTGIYGADINDMIALGTNVIAAASSGLFRSSDDGTSWQRVSVSRGTFFTGGYNALATDGTTVLAGGGDEILRSTDGGNSWKPTASPQPGGEIQFLAISGSLAIVTSQITIAGGVLGYTYDSLYCSTNGGQTWQLASNGLPTDITYDPIAIYGDTMMAATGNLLYYSTTAGNSWSFDTLPVGNSGYITWLTRAGGRIFAYGSGLYSSSDGGRDWDTIHANNLPPYVRTLNGVGSDLITLSDTQVWLSTDRGTNWEPFGTGLTNGMSLWDIAFSNNEIFVGTVSNSVWRRPLSNLSVPVPAQPRLTVSCQNSPNPFGETTKLFYSLPEASLATIEIFDPVGRVVQNISEGYESAGRHSAELSLQNLPDGAYFVRLLAGLESSTCRILKSSAINLR